MTLAVRELDTSFHFYGTILGFRPLCKWHRGAYFSVGGDPGDINSGFWFCLSVDAAHQPPSGYTHLALSVAPGDFDRMSQRIKNSGAPLFKENQSPGNSLYFLDPDGHKLEIHVGTVTDRLHAKRSNLGSWQGVEWFV